jgi:hypothetical protein
MIAKYINDKDIGQSNEKTYLIITFSSMSYLPAYQLESPLST